MALSPSISWVPFTVPRVLCDMSSSIKISSNTTASTTSNKQHVSDQQSSLIPARRLKKTRSAKDVVLHHPSAPSPAEDWILFPDEVIVTKHCSVRVTRSRKAKPVLQMGKSSQPMPTSEETQARFKQIISACAKPCQRDALNSVLKQSFATAETFDEAVGDHVEKSPKPEPLQRLPTPDISDVDEDSFWSCCGSSDGSR